MKNKFYKILVLAGLLILPGSCINDLDQVPQDQTQTIENQFAADAYGTYQGLNAKLYAQLSVAGQGGPNGEVTDASDLSGFDGGASNFFRVMWNTQELITDEAKNGWSGDAGMIPLSQAQVNSSNVILKNFYYRIYTGLTKCNEFVRESTDEKMVARGLTDSEIAEVTYYRAEARFLRALLYYYQMDNFGTGPFIDESTMPSGDAPSNIYSRQQLFNYIESELLDIMDDLRSPQAVYGRADQSAAWMLLAKLYLNAEVYTGTSRYADCYTYVNKVITEGGYTLDDTYAYTFMGDNHLSTEIIFPIVSDPNYAQSYGNMSYLINAAGYDGVMPAFYLGSSGQWGGNKTTREFMDLFSSADKRAMFYVSSDLTEYITDLSDYDQGYRVTKFTNIRRDGTYIAGGSGANFVDTDFPVFRLSDAYLMYAECYLNGSGDATTAMGYVNALRNRAGLSDLSTALSKDFIIDERGRELYWEAWRRQDLIRFGLLEGSTYTWNWKGTASGSTLPSTINLYPFPYDELILNPNLTQNPGY